MRRIAVLAALGAVLVQGQVRQLTGATSIQKRLERLNTVGSVLMIAAHPDDENTALLAWSTQNRHLRTGYLSLTRGEGGQNLIGPEQGALLGVIRTQELLAARQVDGAQQFFTRAIDFGFSKSSNEVLQKWGRDRILGDVVWVIRKFQPDVIVLRFSGTDRDGHGAHTASALLGKEAFAAAADPSQFPEQLKYVQPWQAKRVLWNAFSFNREEMQKINDTPGRIAIELGAFDPVLGVSYGEMAGLSRSQHKSQGMGSPERRDSNVNSFFVVGGSPAEKDLFEGVDLSWKRLPGGAAVQEKLDKAAAAYDLHHPEEMIPALLEARSLIEKMDHPEARRKLAELDELVVEAAGLWVDVSADRQFATTGDVPIFELTAVNRGNAKVSMVSAAITGLPGIAPFTSIAGELPKNRALTAKSHVKIPAGSAPTQPYWLRHPQKGDVYEAESLQEIGPPEGPAALNAEVAVEVEGTKLTLQRPVVQRYVDRVRGETVRPFAITPAFSLVWPSTALVFPDTKPRDVTVGVVAHGPKGAGTVVLEAPKGWRVEPATQRFGALPGVEEWVHFKVTPPAEKSAGLMKAYAQVQEQKFETDFRPIVHEHIPPQIVLPRAEAIIARDDIKVAAKRVGYITGVGDGVAEAIRQLGCEVTLIEPGQLVGLDLGQFDAVVTGVRAFNVRQDLRDYHFKLWEYIEKGGTVVVQYNMMDGQFFSSDPGTLKDIGPLPIKIGRERVTVEEGPVSMALGHELLSWPNQITPSDFGGWVQERGLYFPSSWDDRYATVIGLGDPGEKRLTSAILYYRSGLGAYVYTSLSFFRQLPAGVPGAYKLFANLLSAAKAPAH